MSTIPPAIHDLARQLLAAGPVRVGSSNGDVDEAVRACEKLRAPLTKLAGAAGFSSLLSRALARARRRVPALEGLRIDADGSLAGFDEVQQDSAAPEAVRQGGVVLMAELLGLLAMLIGEPLTLSLVREAWPDTSVGAMTQSTEEET